MPKSKIDALQEKILKDVQIYQHIISFLLSDLEKTKLELKKLFSSLK